VLSVKFKFLTLTAVTNGLTAGHQITVTELGATRRLRLSHRLLCSIASPGSAPRARLPCFVVDGHILEAR
jgi:hypothetical protein